MIYFEITLVLVLNIISIVLLIRNNKKENFFKKEIEEIKKNYEKGREPMEILIDAVFYSICCVTGIYCLYSIILIIMGYNIK